MNLLKKYLVLLGLSVSAIIFFNAKLLHATSDYGLSCTNDAYGTHLGTSLYLDAGDASLSAAGTATYGAAAYTGLDCVYAGAGLTNSVAIVSGDVARAAANAIVNSITDRISVAMAQSADTAAHMSYSSNGNGIGMAANRVFNGLSIWTNYSDSDFENDQVFTNVQKDSNQYDGDSSSISLGIDRMFGNILVGISGTSFDVDIDTTANTGTYKADGETYGVYVGLDTGVLKLAAGYGVGEYDIETTRLDQGTANVNALITGTSSADVEYYHLSAMANIARGSFSISPRLTFKSLDLNTDGFTDVVPDDSNSIASDTTTTADVTQAAFDASSETVAVGVSVARSLGKLTPFLDLSYASEDSTAASYKTEIRDDGFSDQSASDADGYYTVGAGINLAVRNRLAGRVSIVETMDRDDYSETTVSATIKLSF